MSKSVNSLKTITSDWLTKVFNEKDLKPVRQANYTQELVHWLNYINVVPEDVARWFLVVNLQELRSMVSESEIGGKPLRLDLYRRLWYLELELT